jgi:glucose-6-phosphate 1-dehydrogenase
MTQFTYDEQIWLRENVLALLQDNIENNDFQGTLDKEGCKQLIKKILYMEMNQGRKKQFEELLKS